MRLSHSQKDKFISCPRHWKLYYKDRIRPTHTTSALVFGNAMDEALNILLLTKKKELTDEEQQIIKQDVTQTFLDTFHTVYINKQKVEHPETDTRIFYYKSDYFYDILTDEDKQKLVDYINTWNFTITDPEQLRKEMQVYIDKSGYGALDRYELGFINLGNFLSLKTKGLMLLEAFKNEILPEIEEVYSIQRQITFENDNHTIMGLVDYEAKFVGDDNRYTVDNKTSAQKYSSTSVKKSEQLSLYDEYLNNNHGAYTVLVKNINYVVVKSCECGHSEIGGNRKKCPKCKTELTIEQKIIPITQIVKDKINKELGQQTLLDFEKMIEMVDMERFPKWGQKKNCLLYGKPCPYVDYCKNGDLNNLTKI